MLMGDAAEWSFLNSFERCLEVVSRHPADRLGMALDLFHVGSETSVFEQLSEFFDRIKLVQVADRRKSTSPDDSRCSLGTGIIPLDKWIGRLDQLGYSGPLEIELHGRDMESVDYTEMLRESQLFLQNSLAKARSTASHATFDVSHSGIRR